jgi:hypothetical protein
MSSTLARSDAGDRDQCVGHLAAIAADPSFVSVDHGSPGRSGRAWVPFAIFAWISV